MVFILLIKNIIYIDLGINKENFNFEGCMEKKRFEVCIRVGL